MVEKAGTLASPDLHPTTLGRAFGLWHARIENGLGGCGVPNHATFCFFVFFFFSSYNVGLEMICIKKKHNQDIAIIIILSVSPNMTLFMLKQPLFPHFGYCRGVDNLYIATMAGENALRKSEQISRLQ